MINRKTLIRLLSFAVTTIVLHALIPSTPIVLMVHAALLILEHKLTK